MTTKHTHAVVFGRRVASCPRCAELAAGAPPVVWQRLPHADRQRQCDEARAHFAPGGRHALGQCGPVCTFGDY